MRVLHVPYCFFPDSPGGTEVYVAALAEGQRQLGIEAAVAAPDDSVREYDHAGISVYRFAIGRPTLRELYGEGDPAAAISFQAVLKRYRPDVVHLHAATSAVSVRLMEAAKAMRIPVVFTYHTPTVSCLRGTLLRSGREVCSGELDRHACTECSLQALGIQRPLASLLSRIPVQAGRFLGRCGKEGGVWTALRMPELTAVRHASFHRMMELPDRIVAVCNWVARLLERNGVSPGKIVISRQGLAHAYEGSGSDGTRAESLRVAFFGRFARVKGVDVLVRALDLMPDIAAELDLYGIAQDEEGRAIIRSIADAGDRRIRIMAPVASDQVVPTLSRYDVLAAPSQWLETGPLVVYEAFAARVPVIGSDLGGIAELIQHESNGLLIPPGSPASWAAALTRLATEKGLVERLRAGIRAPRTMDTVAGEMAELYCELTLAAR